MLQTLKKAVLKAKNKVTKSVSFLLISNVPSSSEEVVGTDRLRCFLRGRGRVVGRRGSEGMSHPLCYFPRFSVRDPNPATATEFRGGEVPRIVATQ